MIDASLRLRLDLTDTGGDPRGCLAARVALAVVQEQAPPGHAGLAEQFPRANLSVDAVQLATSASAPGSYYILTCGCGIPECSRLYQPLAVTHAGSRIIWHIPGGDAGYDIDATTISFDRTAYRIEITQLTALLHSARPTSIVCYYHNSFETVLASIKNGLAGSC